MDRSRKEKQIEDLLDDPSFIRWAEGIASRDEKKEWDEWVARSEKNRKRARQAQQQLAGFSFKPSEKKDKDAEWAKINEKINKMDGGRKGKHDYAVRKTSSRKNFWIGAAALVLMTIMGGIFYYHVVEQQVTNKQKAITKTTFSTEYGQRKKISMSDGSTIVLNANTDLNFNMESSSSSVTVYVDGEAYFSVNGKSYSRNTPFTVRTDDGFVNVVGTEFVVNTRDRKTRVILNEGSVKVFKNTSAETPRSISLDPRKMAVLGNSMKDIKITEVNPEVYTSWITETLVFSKTPLKKVVKRLENTFGVKVIVNKQELCKRKISGSIDNAELPVIVSALSKILSVPADIKDDVVYLGEKKNI